MGSNKHYFRAIAIHFWEIENENPVPPYLYLIKLGCNYINTTMKT